MGFTRRESNDELKNFPVSVTATLSSRNFRGQTQLFTMYGDCYLIVNSASMAAHHPAPGQTWLLKPEYTPNGHIIFCSLAPASVAESPAQLGLKADLEVLREVSGGSEALKLCIRTASRQLGLSKEQVFAFISNTPDGKKGDELWMEYTRRSNNSTEPEAYNFCSFMREVLSEAGCPYTGPAN